MLSRRRFLGGLSASLLAAPVAQSAWRVWRVGVLSGLSPDAPRWIPFREGLREFGYIEGKNIAFEWRSSRGQAQRFGGLASELVRLKVDVIVASDNAAIAAAQQATRQIPIVMQLAMDPVASGFVDSLSRPGGNITGLSAQGTEVQGKTLQILREAVPSASRVAVVWDPTEPGRREVVQEAERAARALGLHALLLEARSAAALDGLFATMGRERVDAVLVQVSQMFGAQSARIANLAAQHRLPTMCIARWYSEAGGLMSYGLHYGAQFRRTAYFVAKLLGGVQPADLPVEQPTTFELVINLRTAKALGLTIPPALLLRADQVIE
jgi:putative ABC transport system substrate-binding protein